MTKVLLTAVGVLAGGALVFGWLHSKDAVHFQTFFTSHDEPIIVENGPIKITFSPREKKDVGELRNNGSYFLRYYMDPPKIVRIWRQGTDTGGRYQEITCGGECKIKGDSLVLGLTNGKKLAFNWTQHDHTPIGMNGYDYLFDDVQSGNDQIAAQDKALQVDTVMFDGAPKDAPIKVRQDSTDIVVVKLCSKMGDRYCADYPTAEKP